MGNVLLRIFQIVEAKGGLPARVKLVQVTGITQQQAGEMKDKVSLIRRVQKAAAEILGFPIDEPPK